MSTSAPAISQYITFRLGDERFAVDVAQVREILELPYITRVPTAPGCMRGVVNVRGKATPVVDLRTRFGLPPIRDSVNSRIIVIEVDIEGVTTAVGGLADSVEDVIELESSGIARPPSVAMRWRSELIRGVGRRGDDFVIVVDIGAVFSIRQGAAHAEVPAAASVV